jgi:hypothetical protein
VTGFLVPKVEPEGGIKTQERKMFRRWTERIQSAANAVLVDNNTTEQVQRLTGLGFEATAARQALAAM